MQETRKRGFSLLFIVLIALCALSAISIGFFSVRYFLIYDKFEKSVEEKALGQVERGVNSFYSYFQNLKATVETFSEYLNTNRYDAVTLAATIKSKMEENKFLTLLGVAFKPYYFDKNSRLYPLFFYRHDDLFLPLRVAYDYTLPSDEAEAVTDWYSKAIEKGATWVGPYWAVAMKEHIIVYSKRIYSPYDVKMKTPIGVLAGAFSLEYLKDKIKALSLGKLGYGFIISDTGQYIAHPAKEHYLEEKTLIQDVIKLHQTQKEHAIGMSEYFNEITGQKSILVFKDIPQTDLVLCVVLIKDQTISDFHPAFLLNKIALMVSIGAFFILLTALFFRIIFRLDSDEDL